jgi:hypothetical protein
MYDKENDIEYLLKEEIRDKKRTGTGVFSRASRRGYTGAVRTQVDYLKGKAKKEYMGNGEITVSNMYDTISNIPSLSELRDMDKEVAKGIVTYARSKHKMKELTKHWGRSDHYLYSTLFKELDINTKAYHARGTKIVNNTDKNPTVSFIQNIANSNSHPEPSDLFELKYIKSEANGKTIKDRIMDYLTVLEEEGIYEISFKIKERR